MISGVSWPDDDNLYLQSIALSANSPSRLADLNQELIDSLDKLGYADYVLYRVVLRSKYTGNYRAAANIQFLAARLLPVDPAMGMRAYHELVATRAVLGIDRHRLDLPRGTCRRSFPDPRSQIVCRRDYWRLRRSGVVRLPTTREFPTLLPSHTRPVSGEHVVDRRVRALGIFLHQSWTLISACLEPRRVPILWFFRSWRQSCDGTAGSHSHI